MSTFSDSHTSKASLLARKQPEEALRLSANRFLHMQYEEGYWVFDLEADVTIPSEYVMFQRFVGRSIPSSERERLRNYIRSKQLPDGGWPIFDVDGHVDISASVKAYMALKLLGDSLNDEHMVKARQIILSLGGAAKVNVFTRILLALFGQISWKTPPAMPIEIMLLPKWFFFHLSKVSYWSRTVIVPLLILYHKRPVHRLSPSESVRELFITPPEELRQLDDYIPGQWRKNAFILLDKILKRTIHLIPRRVKNRALRQAEEWSLEHMRGTGGIGAIFPAMANAAMALKVLGYPADHPEYVRTLQAIDDLMLDRLAVEAKMPLDDPTVSYDTTMSAAPDIECMPRLHTAICDSTSTCQPCLSPIWDTCLSMSALLEGGLDQDHASIRSGMEWLFTKQIFTDGDWMDKAPGLAGGGWAFQFENNQYPDVDDSSMVIMALLRAGAHRLPQYREPLAQGLAWTVGMQNSDGGWGAFDIDNNYLYLNDIPFADHGALLDPSTSDLTGRCIEMLGMLGYGPDYPAVARGIRFLKKEQEENGSWFGRWGVNFLYGTWSVLCGLRSAGEDMNAPYVRKAVEWLNSCQNMDGGWGETCYSYSDPSFAGKGDSTPSQTAWALLGLLAAGEVNSKVTLKGVQYLLDRQQDDGGWEEAHFTGTGFPRVFYLRYHGYSHYFPLWALGVFNRLRNGQQTIQQIMTLPTPEHPDNPMR